MDTLFLFSPTGSNSSGKFKNERGMYQEFILLLEHQMSPFSVSSFFGYTILRILHITIALLFHVVIYHKKGKKSD